LLYGIFDDEFIDKNFFVLSYAMGAVGGLIFYRWIPPWVVMNDGVSFY
jgi:hypothetical protein